MNELQVFNNDLFGEIRVGLIDNEPWFVGRDVVKRLGYEVSKTTSYTFYINKYCSEEDTKKLNNCDAQLFGIKDAGRKGEILINEFGLYDLVLDAPLPSAKAFRKWVTHEVLPQIRKTGGYIPVTKEQKRDSYMIEDPIERAYAWIEEQKERDRLEAENEKLLNVIEEQEDTIDSLKAVGISEPYNVQSMCQHLPGKPYPNEVYNKLIELGWLCKTNVATYNVTTKGRNKIYKHGRGICFYIKGWNEFKNCLKSRNKNQ